MTRIQAITSRRSFATTVLGAAFSVGMVLASAQGFAMDNNVFDSGKSKSDLEKDGYDADPLREELAARFRSPSVEDWPIISSISVM